MGWYGMVRYGPLAIDYCRGGPLALAILRPPKKIIAIILWYGMGQIIVGKGVPTTL
jgi:hypothetical protein